MPFTEFTCRSGGSNLNPGTTSGSGEEGTANVYTAVGDSDGTSVFTPSDGSNPVSAGVAVGQFASVYVTAGAVTTGFVGRITAVVNAANGAITVSTTAKVGSFPANSAGAHTISIRVGGACRGPNGTDGYPLTLINDNLQNTATNPPRINLKNDQSYQLSAGFTTAATATSVITQGYTATFGDGGQWNLSGPATGPSFTLLTWGTVNAACYDTLFGPCGDTGSADLVSGTGQYYESCIFTDAMGSGCANGSEQNVNCEFYNCNRSNTAAKGGLTNNGGTPVAIRCIAHHNAGANSHGLRAGRAEGCILWANGGNGLTAIAGPISVRGSAFYGNGAAGIGVTGNAAVAHIENNAFCSNGTYGVDDNNNGVGVWRLRNNAYGSGTKVNTSGQTRFHARKSAVETGAVTIAADQTPWKDPDNGDFRVTLTALRAAGYGAYKLTRGGYSGAANTVDQPDIGGPHVEPVLPAVGSVRSGTTYGVLSNQTGTHTDPAVGNVRTGIQWGAGGTEFTGTLTLPAVGLVISPNQYGAGGTEFTGTYQAAPVGKVRSGYQYGAGGTQFTGTDVLPAVTDVRTGVQYGTGGTEFTGNLSTATDYPAVGNVRSGVGYNFGALTGTMTEPAVGDVRLGVTYGAGGTEFTGTLFTPTTPTGGLTSDVRAIVRGLLDVVNVLYLPRRAGDAFDPAVVWQARRQPLTSGDDGNELARRSCRWQLYRTAGQAVLPARNGRVIDEAGVRYEVVSADRRFGDLVFTLDCVQDLPITNP